MELVVLGSSGSWPGPDRACSGYLVRTDTTHVVVDLGPGALSRLHHHLPAGGFAGLDAVVVSHAHPDHWTDLAGLAVGLRYFVGHDGLDLYAGTDTLAAADQLLAGLNPPFRPTTVTAGDQVVVGDITIGFAMTDHPVPTLAMRFDTPGATLAYTADTGPHWSLHELGAGIDVAVCEATFTDATASGVTGHLTARQAGAMAASAGVGHLVLSHLAPGSVATAAADEAGETFGGPISVAHDGLHVRVGRIADRGQI